MKKNKRLQKISRDLAAACLINGQFSKIKIAESTKKLMKLPAYQAIYALSEFRRQLQRLTADTILQIESAVSLSDAQVKSITRLFENGPKMSEIKTLVNKQVLGGIRIKKGDMVYDSTIDSRIKLLKYALTSKGMT